MRHASSEFRRSGCIASITTSARTAAIPVYTNKLVLSRQYSKFKPNTSQLLGASQSDWTTEQRRLSHLQIAGPNRIIRDRWQLQMECMRISQLIETLMSVSRSGDVGRAGGITPMWHRVMSCIAVLPALSRPDWRLATPARERSSQSLIKVSPRAKRLTHPELTYQSSATICFLSMSRFYTPLNLPISPIFLPSRTAFSCSS